jgi:DNA-binding beta-propeller fold protein YncE
LLSFNVLPDGYPGPANIPPEITGGPPVAFFPPPQWGAVPAGPVTVSLRRASLTPGASVGAYAGDGLGGAGAPNLRTTHLSHRMDGSVRNLGTAPIDVYLVTVLPAAATGVATPEPAAPTTPAPVASPVPTGDVAEFVWQVTGGDEPLINPGGVKIAPDGTVWVVDSRRNRFQIFDANGAFLGTWGTTGDGDGEFNFVRANGDALGGIAFAADGSIYVADTGNRRVEKFDRNRAFVTAWGGYGTGDEQFVDPFSIAVDASGNVYVVDDRRDDVQKFTANGSYLATFGAHGYGDGQLNFTGGVAVDGDGNVLVADFGNNRVVRFAPDGSFLDAFGEAGSGDGQFNHPADLALDAAGRIYVADADNQRIQVFAPDGAFLASWGEPGNAPGQFTVPIGVALDGDGNIYVSELFGNRVQKFRLLPLPAPEATPTA